MIAETNWAQPDLEVIIEIKDGRMVAMTNSYDPTENPMSSSDRFWVAGREYTAKQEELN